MSEKGRNRVWSLVAIFFPLTLLVAVAVFSGGDVIAEDRGDPTPPPTGDWYVNASTRIEGGYVNVTGNIFVGRGATLTLKDTLLTVNSSPLAQFTFLVKAGATLVVNGSTLHLDIFESEPQAALVFSGGAMVTTRGQFLSRSQSTFLTDTEIRNQAPDGAPDMPGGDALLILDGKVNSEAANVVILNKGGDAGIAGPGLEGRSGGRATMISNVSIWNTCIITNTAGESRGGGLGLASTPGGNGGPGADVVVRLRSSLLEDVTITNEASQGGIGARGSRNITGNGGDGGNGADGGSAWLYIDCADVLEIRDCTLDVRSGNGGSGGSGGEAIDGDGGHGGMPGMAGDAYVTVTSQGDVHLTRTTLRCLAGEGGYGGDYGRHESGIGTFGTPSAGGNGGTARVQITSPWDLYANGLTIESRGGAGLDGGGGYDQGERGGNGGDGIVRVRVNGSLEAMSVDLQALGGNGGPGGQAYSDINGAGGDGGDALIEFTGLAVMDVEDFSLIVLAGEGGLGDKPIYDGYPGGAQFDLDTEYLWMGNGTLNMPLDDLHGDAVGYLYRVIFDMDFGIHALPQENAVVYEVVMVTVRVVDNPDPVKAKPLEDYEVAVFDIDTGALVTTSTTNERGECFFNLPIMIYTAKSVKYKGSYHMIASSPDREWTKKVRVEIQKDGMLIIIAFEFYEDPLVIEIEQPLDGEEYAVYSNGSGLLSTFGTIFFEGTVRGAWVQLVPEGGLRRDWPTYNLTGPTSGLWDDPLRFMSGGRFIPPPENWKNWTFFYNFQMFEDGSSVYFNGTWRYYLIVSTELRNYMDFVDFNLVLDRNIGRPWVLLVTQLNGRIVNGNEFLIEGMAYDSYQLVAVEIRVDGGDWEPVTGLEEWSYRLDLSSLENGVHIIEVRAWDGEHFSDVHYDSLVVERQPSQPNGGDGGIDGSSWPFKYTVIAAGLILLVIALALLVAIYVVRRRSPPDN